jgi:hypothetical protein
MRSRFEVVGPVVLKALRAGCSVATAAAAGGVAEDTVRTWIKTGRRQPGGRFGAIAEAFDARGAPVAALRPAGPSVTADPPDRAELLALLGQQARKGNVRAIELLLRDAPAAMSPEAERRYRRLLSLVPPND